MISEQPLLSLIVASTLTLVVAFAVSVMLAGLFPLIFTEDITGVAVLTVTVLVTLVAITLPATNRPEIKTIEPRMICFMSIELIVADDSACKVWITYGENTAMKVLVPLYVPFLVLLGTCKPQ